MHLAQVSGFFKWKGTVDNAGHINHSNDFCPQWTETVYYLVDRSRCGRNDYCPWWTEVVDDSYRCYTAHCEELKRESAKLKERTQSQSQ